MQAQYGLVIFRVGTLFALLMEEVVSWYRKISMLGCRIDRRGGKLLPMIEWPC